MTQKKQDNIKDHSRCHHKTKTSNPNTTKGHISEASSKPTILHLEILEPSKVTFGAVEVLQHSIVLYVSKKSTVPPI
ncbi:MAG: hypothetical protein P1V18_00365 [Candidatus Gracilibacteria bacterium]|nr:hypothetical protein [Candidatus Gracilibacteria bacterium]